MVSFCFFFCTRHRRAGVSDRRITFVPQLQLLRHIGGLEKSVSTLPRERSLETEFRCSLPPRSNYRRMSATRQQRRPSFDFCRPLSKSRAQCSCCGGGGTALIELSCMHVVCAVCVNKTLASLLLLEKVRSSGSNMISSISVFRICVEPLSVGTSS